MEFGDGHDCEIIFRIVGDTAASWFPSRRDRLETFPSWLPILLDRSKEMADTSNDPTPEPIRSADELLPAGLRGAAPPGRGADQQGCSPARRCSRPPWSTRPTCAWWANQDPGWEGPPPLLRRRGAGHARDPHRAGTPQGQPQARRRRHRVELAEGLALIEPPADDLLALDEAIEQLQAEKPHLAEIVLLRYFTGLSVEETAAVLGRSVSTVTRDWRFARAWLARRLGERVPTGPEEGTDD